MIFTSDNGASVFFPANGVIADEGSAAQGEWFSVWSSQYASSSGAVAMFGSSSDGCKAGKNPRIFGLSVRGVLGELNEEDNPERE
jgi:hypothetical protein